MGWWIEGAANEHEGYVQYLSPDGRSSGTSSGNGVLLDKPDRKERAEAAWGAGQPPTDDDICDLLPWAEVAGLRVVCECGWSGSTWSRDEFTTTSPEWDSIDAETSLLADGRLIDDVALEEWQDHVAPITALDRIREAADAVRAAERDLDEAVRAARALATPTSWEAIGRAARITRQSAHQRWADRTADQAR